MNSNPSSVTRQQLEHKLAQLVQERKKYRRKNNLYYLLALVGVSVLLLGIRELIRVLQGNSLWCLATAFVIVGLIKPAYNLVTDMGRLGQELQKLDSEISEIKRQLRALK